MFRKFLGTTASLLLVCAFQAQAEITHVAKASVFVKDYDEAIQWYSTKLGFELRGDFPYGEGLRFVTVGLRGQKDFELVLIQGGAAFPTYLLRQVSRLSNIYLTQSDRRLRKN
jgi:hypothetical protein